MGEKERTWWRMVYREDVRVESWAVRVPSNGTWIVFQGKFDLPKWFADRGALTEKWQLLRDQRGQGLRATAATAARLEIELDLMFNT